MTGIISKSLTSKPSQIHLLWEYFNSSCEILSIVFFLRNVINVLMQCLLLNMFLRKNKKIKNVFLPTKWIMYIWDLFLYFIFYKKGWSGTEQNKSLCLDSCIILSPTSPLWPSSLLIGTAGLSFPQT